MGGTGKIIKAFEKLMKEEKIKIVKNSEVQRIITKKNTALGIKIKAKKFLQIKLL